jgi:sporulation protein YlmC with PRC-barrel domain
MPDAVMGDEKPKVKVKIDVPGHPEDATVPVYRAQQFVGMKARDPNGKEIGRIEDLVVELHSGEVRYAALSFGGFAGLGKKLFAIPLAALKFEHDESNSGESHFVLNVPEEKFKSAPGFDKDNWPDFADEKWSAEIDTYFGNLKIERKISEHKGKSREKSEIPSVHRATKIEGLTVKNDSNESLGKVEDLVIDMRHSTIRYAALSFGGFLGLGDKLFAIPWNGFTVQTGSKREPHLILHVSKERLKNAPGFDKKNWPKTGDPRWSAEIDRHYQEDIRGDTTIE